MVAVGGRLTTARERAALVENLRERAIGADRGGVVVDAVVSGGLVLLLRGRGLLLILLLGLSVGLPLLIVILLLLATLVLLPPLLLVLARRLVLLLLLPFGLHGRRSVAIIIVVATADQREPGRADPGAGRCAQQRSAAEVAAA